MKTRTASAAGIVVGVLAALVVCGVADAAEQHDFSRYKVIIDRAPFGHVGAEAAAEARPSFAARFAFRGLVSSSDNEQLLAIIEDRERNRIHFRAEGEAIEGVKVVRIEKLPARLVLQQGLEVATLMYEPASSVVPMQPYQQPQQPSPAVPTPGPRRIPFRRGG